MKTIKQVIKFKASPEEVYSALMSSKKHSAFTGSAAKISNKVGGKFSAYEGGLYGKNLKLVKNKEIVQEWRCVMDHWPKDHFSKVSFVIKKTKSGSQLIFTHTQVPDKSYASIKQGWTDYYWNPMKKFLEN
ncbi:MAG: SRPBCC domain-containing protein [Candidatus Aenigmarchaeota archaeon]|nr:SRPBCC domain-containing protein [Candidatus Aenigmarchaeota archaeon]